jgi:hypothetical protein
VPSAFSTGARSSASSASGSRDRLSHRAASPPALLHGGLEPVQFAKAPARAFGDQVQAGGRPGDRPAPAGEAFGRIGAQHRQRVAIAEADRRVGALDRHEGAASEHCALTVCGAILSQIEHHRPADGFLTWRLFHSASGLVVTKVMAAAEGMVSCGRPGG